MKIIKIELDKLNGILIVYVDTFPNLGFNFKIDEIINENDFLAKIRQRVNLEAAQIQTEQDNEARFNQFKSLEGREL